MYLTHSVETTAEETLGMAGFIPGNIKMHTTLQAIGYREVNGHQDNFLLNQHQKARGHKFHYSTFHPVESF